MSRLLDVRCAWNGSGTIVRATAIRRQVAVRIFAVVLLGLCGTSTMAIAQPTIPAVKPAVITGTVLGSDGRPMARADVVLTAVLSNDPDGAPELARARTDARGRFAIASSHIGGAILTLHGTGHEPRYNSLDLSPGYQLQINARLARVRYAANLDSVRVAGDFNGFRSDTSARLLQRNLDGVYTLDVPVTSDSLTYVLLRLTQRGATNGTANDAQVFTGNGYRSVTRATAGIARVTFDPARAVRDTTPAHVEFIGGAEARAARLSDSLAKHTALYSQINRSGRKADTGTWSPSVHRAMRELSREKSPLVREMLLLELMQLAQLGGAVPPRIGGIALNELAPNASAWTTRESLVESLPFLPQWVADSVVHLMRPAPAEIMSSADSARVRISNAKLAARFDSSARTATSDGAQAQWMQWAVATTYGWLPARSTETLARLQAQHPARYATLFALQQWGSQQKLRKSALLPPLNVSTVSDTAVRITNAQLAGKTVLIDFWATWCSPCLEEMSYLHDAYKEFSNKGLEILSISANDSVTEVNTFRAKRWPMPWLNGWVSGGMRGEQFRNYDIYGVPRVVLVGPDGVIIATGQELRGAALGATLRRVLTSGSAVPAPGGQSRF